MATVISVYTSEGCVARCDARCHNATSPDCDCICGGRLHGIGPMALEERIGELFIDGALEAQLMAFASRNGYRLGDLRVGFRRQCFRLAVVSRAVSTRGAVQVLAGVMLRAENGLLLELAALFEREGES